MRYFLAVAREETINGAANYLHVSQPTLSRQLMMRKDSPLANNATITAANFADIPLLVSRQSLVKPMFSQWLGYDVTQLNIVATYNLLNNAALMVDEGIGYAMTLDRIINTSGDSNLCFTPLTPRLDVGLVIVWKKYQTFSRAAEKFLGRIQERFAPL